MKSKKNGTKENVGKWFYFWMKIKKKKKDIMQRMFFLNFFFVLFCYYFLNKAIKLLKLKKDVKSYFEEYNLYVTV